MFFCCFFLARLIVPLGAGCCDDGRKVERWSPSINDAGHRSCLTERRGKSMTTTHSHTHLHTHTHTHTHTHAEKERGNHKESRDLGKSSDKHGESNRFLLLLFATSFSSFFSFACGSTSGRRIHTIEMASDGYPSPPQKKNRKEKKGLVDALVKKNENRMQTFFFFKTDTFRTINGGGRLFFFLFSMKCKKKKFDRIKESMPTVQTKKKEKKLDGIPNELFSRQRWAKLGKQNLPKKKKSNSASRTNFKEPSGSERRGGVPHRKSDTITRKLCGHQK